MHTLTACLRVWSLNKNTKENTQVIHVLLNIHIVVLLVVLTAVRDFTGRKQIAVDGTKTNLHEQMQRNTPTIMSVEHWLNSELQAYIDKMGSSIRIIHMHKSKLAAHRPEKVEMWLFVHVQVLTYTIGYTIMCQQQTQCLAVHEMTRDSADWQEPTSKQMDAHSEQSNESTNTNSSNLQS